MDLPLLSKNFHKNTHAQSIFDIHFCLSNCRQLKFLCRRFSYRARQDSEADSNDKNNNPLTQKILPYNQLNSSNQQPPCCMRPNKKQL
jgi:hypothetical protein